MKTVWRMLRARLAIRLVYRADFVVNALGDLLLAAVGLVFLSTLFRHIPKLADWSMHEVLFCWGFAEAVVGLFFVCFQGLYVLNQRYILGGELDRVLLRPADPYLQVLADNVSLEDLPIFILGLAVMAVAGQDLAPLPAYRWLLAPLFVLAGTGVLGGVLTAVSSTGFLLFHRGTTVGLVFQLSVFNRYPLDLFARPLRHFLTFLLPIGFAGFYPASLFLSQSRWYPWAWATPGVALVALAGGYAIWTRSLRHYTSSGH